MKKERKMQRLNSKKTYSEIYEILHILGEEYIQKIPKKLYILIENQRDVDFEPNLLKEDGSLDESLISRETLALFAVLNMKYFVEDEQVREEFFDTLEKNEQKYQKELREKYNPDNIFKKSNQEPEIEQEISQDNVSMIEYKESIFKRIIDKIKGIFYR